MELKADESASCFLATMGRYHAAIEQILTSCLENTSNNLLFQLDRICNQQEPRMTMFTPDEALRLVVDQRIRGLEYYTVDALDLESCRLFRNYRDICVSRVLDCQGAWRNDRNLTSDQKATLLAQQARQYSSVSVMFARFLADGDAMSAVDDNSCSTECTTESEAQWSYSPTNVIDVLGPVFGGLESGVLRNKVLESLALSSSVASL